MKTNTPDTAKRNYPNSDQTARETDAAEIEGTNVSGDLAGLQTSNKSGKHSSVEKLAASRPNLGTGNGAKPVPGAFGDDEDHVITGRLAGPGTNQVKCESCGRWFNTTAELSSHEPECRLAKQATPR